MRITLAIVCMFLAVGSPEGWPMSKTILNGIGWTGMAGILLWPELVDGIVEWLEPKTHDF